MEVLRSVFKTRTSAPETDKLEYPEKDVKTVPEISPLLEDRGAFAAMAPGAQANNPAKRIRASPPEKEATKRLWVCFMTCVPYLLAAIRLRFSCKSDMIIT